MKNSETKPIKYYSKEASDYLLSQSEYLTLDQQEDVLSMIGRKRHSYYRENLPEDKQPLTLDEVRALVSLSISTEEAERQMCGQSGMRSYLSIE
jgi:hypothetical protein